VIDEIIKEKDKLIRELETKLIYERAQVDKLKIELEDVKQMNEMKKRDCEMAALKKQMEYIKNELQKAEMNEDRLRSELDDTKSELRILLKEKAKLEEKIKNFENTKTENTFTEPNEDVLKLKEK